MATKEKTAKLVASPPLLLKSIRWLAVVGVFALYLTKEISLGYFLVFGLLFFLSLWVHVSPRVLLVAGKAQTWLALAAFGLAVFDFMSLSRSFLLAVAHFLILIQALRLLSLQTARENLGCLLLSSLMMISVSTLSVDWSFLLMLLTFVPSVIWALMVYNLSMETERVIVDAQNENQMTLFSLNRPAWVNTVVSLRSSAVLAFGVTLFCCVFVFLIFPRFNFQGFRGQFLQPVAKTGMTNQISLSQQATIFEDNTIVMRVQLDPKDIGRWPGYIRGRTLSAFDGVHWTRGTTPTDSALYSMGGVFGIPGVASSRKNNLLQRIYLESMDSSTLFAAGHPFNLKIERPVIFVSGDGSFRRTSNDTWRIYYEVTSSLEAPSHPTILSTDEVQQNLVLGPLADNARIISYSHNVIGEEKLPLKKAQLIERALQNDFEYSLQSRKVTEENPVLAFLFESKKGHCEFFASAMAVMLRQQHIPARMVTGYLSHEINKRGNYVVVRSRYAHAWVEAYFPDEGWISFDPTPASRDNLASYKSRYPEWADMIDNLNLKWNRYIMSYDMDKQVDIFMSFNRRSQKISPNLHFRWPSLNWNSNTEKVAVPSRSGFSINAWILVLVVILLGVAIKLRRRKMGAYEWLHRALMQCFEKYSDIKMDKKTPYEGLLLSQHALGPRLADAQFLVDGYYQMRFNPHFQPEPDYLRSIRRKIKLLKSS